MFLQCRKKCVVFILLCFFFSQQRCYCYVYSQAFSECPCSKVCTAMYMYIWHAIERPFNTWGREAIIYPQTRTLFFHPKQKYDYFLFRTKIGIFFSIWHQNWLLNIAGGNYCILFFFASFRSFGNIFFLRKRQTSNSQRQWQYELIA